MTFLYLSVRYAGIGYAVCGERSTPMVSVPVQTTGLPCRGLAMYGAVTCLGEVVDVMLGVIVIIRLNAMYQRSRKMLIFLVVIFLAITIVDIVIVVIMVVQASRNPFSPGSISA
ncbi:hypothetical protein BDR07DRAFT_565693 [Suillus spraguei]|nr:hypothetical protein BDR07DRAFT_565693 [Suillus spraguei]